MLTCDRCGGSGASRGQTLTYANGVRAVGRITIFFYFIFFLCRNRTIEPQKSNVPNLRVANVSLALASWMAANTDSECVSAIRHSCPTHTHKNTHVLSVNTVSGGCFTGLEEVFMAPTRRSGPSGSPLRATPLVLRARSNLLAWISGQVPMNIHPSSGRRH